MTIIGAQDGRDNVSYQGGMPWHLDDEMAFFRAITLGQVCICGKNTGVKLPKRTTLILGIDILDIKDTPVGSIIIGGPNTWRQYLEADMITRAYVTKIAEDYLGDLQYDLFSEVKKRMDLKPIIYKPDFTVYYGSK